MTDAQATEDKRKIEAYDAARATVKRQGLSRAEYVLRVEAVEERAAVLEAALTEIKQQLPKTQEILRSQGVVFTDIGADPRNWQHVAFSVYTDLCQVDIVATHALQEGHETHE